MGYAHFSRSQTAEQIDFVLSCNRNKQIGIFNSCLHEHVIACGIAEYSQNVEVVFDFLVLFVVTFNDGNIVVFFNQLMCD